MDEQHSPARAVAPRSLITDGVPPAREPFDPALLLEGRRPPPLPYSTGPTMERPTPFDPATHLGERALRGAFNLSTVKPITMMVGGVEMVAVPTSAYEDALRRLSAHERAAQVVEGPGQGLDATGMLDLLLSLHAAEVVSTGQLARATGLDHLAIGDRVADYVVRHAGAAPVRFVAPPEAARVDLVDGGAPADSPEAHGAALDVGRPTEAHGAALDAIKPKRSTTFSSRRRDKSEHRGGPMDREGQPDNRETDPHDLVPRGRRDGLDRA